MSQKIVVPPLGESVSEATVVNWLKGPGETVRKDELLLELETDKVTLEVSSPADGVLELISFEAGSAVKVGDILGVVKEGVVASSTSESAPHASPAQQKSEEKIEKKLPSIGLENKNPPSVNKLLDELDLSSANIPGTGKDGRLRKSDIINHLHSSTAPVNNNDREERVKMTRLRQRIAERLKDAQNKAAILTTFNEVDMTNIMAVRKRVQDRFFEVHGVKLGFMSFFVKACVKALQEIPSINAEIDGEDIVFKNYYDIGVAVGTDKGLVVPVLRNAEALSFADIEITIKDLGAKAHDGKLSMAELTGGTFSITNGGVYGSLMSTPILNPPQSGILGMHSIKNRAVVLPSGEIAARPMMYLALSYDHRIVDGKEAVTFLVRVKEMLENPESIMFDI